MVRVIRLFVLGLATAGLVIGALGQANTVTAGTLSITATGEGWASNYFLPNNTNTGAIANTFSGNEFSFIDLQFQDWFAFNVPNTGGTITGVTINIWNNGQNFNTVPGATYNLYGASSITFGGLVTGPILGSVLTSSADTGISHFVAIRLNAIGVREMNAAQGSQFIFGGFNNGDQIFGYTDGTPVATLDQTTNTVVPEPGGLMLLSLGLASIHVVGRVKKRKARIAA
jgi:hypothetical protein